jgi:hypothetical protein
MSGLPLFYIAICNTDVSLQVCYKVVPTKVYPSYQAKYSDDALG